MQAIGFVINWVEQEQQQVETLESALKAIYPDCLIEKIEDFPSLKNQATVGLWIARYLSAIKTDLIIKIDPDTEVIQKPKVRFTGDVFCAKKWRSSFKKRDYMPHAACVGFTREAAAKIAKECLKQDYVNFPLTTDDYNEEIVLKAVLEILRLDVHDRLDFHCGAARYDAPGFVSFRHP
jgi:hypothetical protein